MSGRTAMLFLTNLHRSRWLAHATHLSKQKDLQPMLIVKHPPYLWIFTFNILFLFYLYMNNIWLRVTLTKMQVLVFQLLTLLHVYHFALVLLLWLIKVSACFSCPLTGYLTMNFIYLRGIDGHGHYETKMVSFKRRPVYKTTKWYKTN